MFGQSVVVCLLICSLQATPLNSTLESVGLDTNLIGISAPLVPPKESPINSTTSVPIKNDTTASVEQSNASGDLLTPSTNSTTSATAPSVKPSSPSKSDLGAFGASGRVFVETTASDKCSEQLCDAASSLVITSDPAGNQTGFIPRALGLPVSLECLLLTKGHHIKVPVIWTLPDGSTRASETINFDKVQLNDTGLYECHLSNQVCCKTAKPLMASVRLSVYEFDETTGIILMLSVIISIVILVGVFIYSQKKKKYHSWLKHEILAASSSSSTLNREHQQSTSKKYLI